MVPWRTRSVGLPSDAGVRSEMVRLDAAAATAAADFMSKFMTVALLLLAE